MEKVSVIVPVHNVELYLDKCLSSLANQTYKNLEIIVIDDGSSDNSGIICDKYAETYANIFVIHKKNEGCSSARNIGIKRATGEWITFADSDDWLDLNYYESLLYELGDQQVDIFLSGGVCQEIGNKKVFHYHLKKGIYESAEDKNLLIAKVLAPRVGETYGKLPPCSAAYMWDKLYRKDFLIKNDMKVDTRFHPQEDVLFNFYAFMRASRVGVGSCIGYHYRIINTSSLRKYNPNMASMCVEAMQVLYVTISNNKMTDIIRQAFYVRCIDFFITSLRCCSCHKDNPATYKEKAEEVKKMKNFWMYKEAILYADDALMSRKQCILIKLLKMKGCFPVIFVNWINETYKRFIADQL